MNNSKYTKFVVIDVETTGFSNHDRIIEIALITLDPESLRVVEEYDTLINPERDITATHIHGISASMVESAPTFAEVAPVLARRLDGAIPIAHNWPFDERMISNEFLRLGSYGRFGDGICTYQSTGLKLELACRVYNVSHVAHCALGDARATAKIFTKLFRENATEIDQLQPSSFVAFGEPNPRTLRRNVSNDSPTFSQRVISYSESPWNNQPSGIYRYALNYVLDDAEINREEHQYLRNLQDELNLTNEDVFILKKLHLATIISSAERDGIITATELAYIEQIARALELDGEPLPEITGLAEHSNFQEGMYICFTGSAYVAGSPISRSELEYKATVARLIPVSNVTKRNCDVLVAADLSSQSGKVRKAYQYKIPVIDVEEFMRGISTGE